MDGCSSATNENFLKDHHLSFKARGLLAYIVSHGPNWNIDLESLVNASDSDGREAVRSGLQELIRHGYITLDITRNAAGKLAGKRYRVLMPNWPRYSHIPPRHEEAVPGHIYIIRGGTYYKIGCSINVKARLKSLRVSIPFPVQIECLIPTNDIVGTEQALHASFADKRIKGEWFNLCTNDIAMIREEYPTVHPSLLNVD